MTPTMHKALDRFNHAVRIGNMILALPNIDAIYAKGYRTEVEKFKAWLDANQVITPEANVTRLVVWYKPDDCPQGEENTIVDIFEVAHHKVATPRAYLGRYARKNGRPASEYKWVFESYYNPAYSPGWTKVEA